MGAVVLCVLALAAFFVVGKSLNGMNTDSDDGKTNKKHKID